MFRKLNLSFIFLYLFINTVYGTISPYIIYTIEDFQIPAENMAELHSQIIPQISHFEPLEIEIIYKETVSEDSLIVYLDTFNNSCSNQINTISTILYTVFFDGTFFTCWR